MLARIRGYRTVATKGGFTPEYDSGCSHLDVATPVLSDAEVIRACKWAPKIADKAAYDVLNEFDERLGLTLESLPPARCTQRHGCSQRLCHSAEQSAQVSHSFLVRLDKNLST